MFLVQSLAGWQGDQNMNLTFNPAKRGHCLNPECFRHTYARTKKAARR